MTNFVEGLVLRAAGLPPSAAAAPRTPPAGEPLDGNFTSEEVIEVPPAVPERRMVTPPPTERVVVHEHTAPESPRAAAERIVEMGEKDTPVSPVATLTPQQPAPPHAATVEKRVLETEREVVIVSPPAVPPPVTHVEAARTEALPAIRPANREVAMPPTARAPDDDERPEAPQAVPAPVMLQPIVMDGTRTVVQPIREERVIETTQSILIEPSPPPPDAARVRVEPAPVLATTDRKREDSPERDEEGARATPSLSPREPIPKTAGEVGPASEREEPPPPRTVVMPQTKSAQGDVPLLSSPESPAPPVSIRIGTIEIRAAAPPPPPPAPAPSASSPSSPDVPSGFDDYARIRRYAPEAW